MLRAYRDTWTLGVHSYLAYLCDRFILCRELLAHSGRGTTAYVAEQWGRRWIRTDTSRVALVRARLRPLTARFDFYKVKGSAGVLPAVSSVSPETLPPEHSPRPASSARTPKTAPEKGALPSNAAAGFVCKTVPHIKSRPPVMIMVCDSTDIAELFYRKISAEETVEVAVDGEDDAGARMAGRRRESGPRNRKGEPLPARVRCFPSRFALVPKPGAVNSLAVIGCW